MASVRLAGNVEILLRILRKLLKEKSKKRINILARCYCVAHGATTVRVTNINRLVKEDHGSIVIP